MSKVVVITGASAGVGRATARAFAERGARIGLIARGVERLEEAAREVRNAGGEALVFPADIADPDACERAAEAVEEAFGPIDIWINNAMVSVFSPVSKMQEREYDRVTAVSYLGTVYGTLAALRRMKPRDHGTIVQVGSALAYRSIPLQSAYCAAKHAIVGFTDSLRCELIRDGSRVRLTAVHLPAVNTPQFGWVKSRLEEKAQPVPPIFQPEVAAEAIVWATEHHRREYFVGFSTFKAVWGQKFAPGWLDHYLAKNAYEGQQLDEPESRTRPHNLWESVGGMQGARGDFDKRAKPYSVHWQLDTHRKTVAAGLAAFAAGVIGGAMLFRQKAGRNARSSRPRAQRGIEAGISPLEFASP